MSRVAERSKLNAAESRGERIEITGGAVLEIDAIFAGAFDLPGD